MRTSDSLPVHVFVAAFAVVLLVALAAPLTARADIIRVCPDGSGDAPTIAAAYAMADYTDEIALCPGTYYEHDIVMRSAVDLYSESDDPANTIIDAQGLGRCLDGSNVGGIPVIRSITFQNGTHHVEGGLLFAAPYGGQHNARYQNCVFRGGAAPQGGAVATHASAGQSPWFVGCLFEDNEATSGDGGAVWSDDFPIIWAQNCTFRTNVAAGHGGAIYHEETYYDGVWVENCVFEINSAGGDGGAIYSGGSGDEIYGSHFAGCRFEGNKATNGGAAYVGSPYGSDSYLSIAGSVFLNNIAIQDGGALVLWRIWQSEDGDPVTGNLLAHNSAGARGGAIAIFYGLHLQQSTLVENGAPSGGHLWVGQGGASVSRSILAFSTEGEAASGPGSSTTDCLDVYGNIGGDYVENFAGQDQVATNFSADPVFCNPEGGDYTLSESSPCAPPGITGCGRVGAYGVGCGAVSVGHLEKRVNWGRLKALYR
jgi:predicted outer membrane repeat protein